MAAVKRRREIVRDLRECDRTPDLSRVNNRRGGPSVFIPGEWKSVSVEAEGEGIIERNSEARQSAISDECEFDRSSKSREFLEGRGEESGDPPRRNLTGIPHAAWHLISAGPTRRFFATLMTPLPRGSRNSLPDAR